MKRGKQWVAIDNFKRKLFLKYEVKRLLLKNLMRNSSLPMTYRYFIFYKKIKLPRWSISPQLVNKCVKTGRVFSVLKKTRYSRFVFRTESYLGHLPGFARASW